MGGVAEVFSFVAPILGSIFGGEPEQQAAPAPPVYTAATAAAPAAPETSTAAEVATSEPVIDTEAARIRADKRRRATTEAANALISLSSTSPTTKTTSLLGE